MIIKKIKNYKYHLLAGGLILAYTYAVTAPLWGDCSNTIIGAPGDGTSGGVWSIWQYHQLDVTPGHNKTPYLSAPSGEALWNPVYISFILNIVPMWLLGFLVNPVCAWNIWIISGFILSAAVVYGLAYWILRSAGFALFAGFAYAFSPYHIEKSTGHMNYLHSWPIPLSLWALLALLKKPTRLKAILLGITIALFAYTDGYYILLGPTMLSIVLGSFISWKLYHRESIIQYLKYFTLAAATAFLLLLPFAGSYLSNKEQSLQFLGASRTNMQAELTTWAVRPLELLVPSSQHPLFGETAARYWETSRHGSNPAEQTLYIGFTVFVLCIIGIFLTYRIEKKKPSDEASHHKLLVLMLLILALCTLFISIIPAIGIPYNGRTVYPAAKIIGEVQSIWRVFSRFFLVFQLAFILLAIIGASLLCIRYKLNRALVSVVVILLIAVEYMMFPIPYWSYNSVPPVYKWLAQQQYIDTVVEYPLDLPPERHSFGYMTYQYIHQKPLFNTGLPAGPNAPLYPVLSDIYNPNTAAILKHYGVDLIIVHPEDQYGSNKAVEITPAGMQKVAQFGKDVVFKINSSTEATPILSVASGFYKPEASGDATYRWMQDQGVLRLLAFNSTQKRARIILKAQSFGGSRKIMVLQNNKVLVSKIVDTDTNYEVIEFEAETESPITLKSSTPSYPAPKPDTRTLSIRLTAMEFVLY